jgi:hypothetical protein
VPFAYDGVAPPERATPEKRTSTTPFEWEVEVGTTWQLPQATPWPRWARCAPVAGAALLIGVPGRAGSPWQLVQARVASAALIWRLWAQARMSAGARAASRRFVVTQEPFRDAHASRRSARVRRPGDPSHRTAGT